MLPASKKNKHNIWKVCLYDTRIRRIRIATDLATKYTLDRDFGTNFESLANLVNFFILIVSSKLIHAS